MAEVYRNGVRTAPGCWIPQLALLAAEIQKMADRSGRSFEETLNSSLRCSVPASRPLPSKPFEIRTKALHARSGFDFDDIEGLLEQVEGPAHR